MRVSPWLRYHTQVHATIHDAIAYIKDAYREEVKIYLAGGINGLSDSDCKDWREYVKQQFPKATLIDPMRRDYRGREDECYEEIIDGDKRDIDHADIILVNASKPSWGTAMEIMYAYMRSSKMIVAFMSL
jgi:nucleoside 2-deoxyribosyltransferase